MVPSSKAQGWFVVKGKAYGTEYISSMNTNSGRERKWVRNRRSTSEKEKIKEEG